MIVRGIYIMSKYKNIFLSLLFVGATLTANAETMDFPTDVSVAEPQDKTMKLTVTINETTEIEMENVPTTGYLEVYSLLGVKITSVNLKKCTDNKCSIDLAKGLYILKAGKVAKKVIIK